MIYSSLCGPTIVLIHLDLGLQGICVGFHYLVQMGYLSKKKKKTYNWVIFLQTHFLFVNSLGFIGKGSIRKRQKKKKCLRCYKHNLWGMNSSHDVGYDHSMKWRKNVGRKVWVLSPTLRNFGQQAQFHVLFFLFYREKELRVVGWTFLLGKVAKMAQYYNF